MTEERLKEIEDRHRTRCAFSGIGPCDITHDIGALIAEVRRLRAENEKLRCLPTWKDVCEAQALLREARELLESFAHLDADVPRLMTRIDAALGDGK